MAQSVMEYSADEKAQHDREAAAEQKVYEAERALVAAQAEYDEECAKGFERLG